jgi:L-ribulose-5-phosphate 3-epimerase
MNNLKFGIIQGRLTESPAGCLQWFPQVGWENEFKNASLLGISFIELIAEINHNPDNPIWTDAGINQIKKLSLENGLAVNTLCNDYIIEHSIHDEKTIKQNLDLLEQCKKLGINKYIMPFFNKSEINHNNFNDFISPLEIISNIANKYDIEISLETILTGEELLDLLNLLNLKNVKVVYDTGNRVAFGHDLSRDIELLSDNINHIHIKDKNIDNENVILGTGLVNFSDVFQSIININYKGSYVFETTRGKNPLKTATYNMQLVDFFIQNSKINV